MYNKYLKVSVYSEYLEKTLGKLIRLLAEMTHCLVLVNTDTRCVTNSILLRLSNSNISFCMPSCAELESSSGIGNYLRSQLETNQEHSEDILILDCQDVIEAIPYTIRDLVDAINSNRDLFTTVFRSVIIISSPPLTYAIQKHAFDFWSCVEWYINASGWFDSPYTIPIIHLRVCELNSSSLLISLFSKDRDLFNKFFDFRDKLSREVNYTPKWFADTLSGINEFKGRCYYDLILQFIRVVTRIPSNHSMFEQRMRDLLNLKIKLDIPQVAAEAYIIIAEFFYNCGNYRYAKDYFKYAHKYLEDTVDKLEDSYILAFLNCNSFVCDFLDAEIDEIEGANLSKELSLRLQGLPSEYGDFISSYLFLADYAFRCTSYSNHKDAFTRLSNMTVTSLPGASISQDVKRALLWESNYMHTESGSTTSDFGYNMDNLIEHLWIAIKNFRAGNYAKAKNIIKCLRYCARSYGYLEIGKLLGGIKKNMSYLQKQDALYNTLRLNNDFGR